MRLNHIVLLVLFCCDAQAQFIGAPTISPTRRSDDYSPIYQEQLRRQELDRQQIERDASCKPDEQKFSSDLIQRLKGDPIEVRNAYAEIMTAYNNGLDSLAERFRYYYCGLRNSKEYRDFNLRIQLMIMDHEAILQKNSDIEKNK